MVPSSEETRDGLFPGLQSSEIIGLSFHAEDGKSLTLEKDSGGSWILPEKGGYPADARKINKFIDKILSIKTRLPVARTVSAQKRLKVTDDKFVRKVVIHLSDSSNARVLYMGSSPSQGQLHVRAGDDDSVYLTTELSAWEAAMDASSWLDRDYVKVPEDRLTHIEIENHEGTLSFSRDASGEWKMDALSSGVVLNRQAFDDLTKKLGAIRVQDVLGTKEEPGYGLAKPTLILRVTYSAKEASQKSRTLSIVVGPKEEPKGTHVVKSSASSFYVTVPSYALRDFMNAEESLYIMKGNSADASKSEKP